MNNFPNAVVMPNSTNLNAITFNNYYYRLKLIAQAVFEWKGLPNGMDERYIERYLFNEGKCVFFKDFEKGWMVAKYTDKGDLNFYDEPTTVEPVCTNGQISAHNPEFINGENCVLIWNNDSAIPTHYPVVQAAADLAEIKRTIDLNIQAQKTPVMIACTEKQRLSMMNAYKQYKGNSPVIVVDKSLEGLDLIKVMKTDAPIVFDKLRLEWKNVWNDTMTQLGVNNANQDKKERLVADEVAANDEQVARSAWVMLKPRQAAAKRMSELCGCEITCEIRSCYKALEGFMDGDIEKVEGGPEE